MKNVNQISGNVLDFDLGDNCTDILSKLYSSSGALHICVLDRNSELETGTPFLSTCPK